MVLLGIIVHKVKELMLGTKSDTMAEAQEDIRTRLENITDKVIEDSINDIPPNEEAFEEIHRSPGGMALLIGASFTFPLELAAQHRLATFIRSQEQRIHGKRRHRWMTCIRKKAGSNKTTQKFLDFLEEPGFLKQVSHTTEKAISELFNTSKDQKTILDRVKDLVSSVIHAAIPQAKAAWYIIDYVKDSCFFAYLFNRLQFITRSYAWLNFLVYAQ